MIIVLVGEQMTHQKGACEEIKGLFKKVWAGLKGVNKSQCSTLEVTTVGMPLQPWAWTGRRREGLPGLGGMGHCGGDTRVFLWYRKVVMANLVGRDLEPEMPTPIFSLTLPSPVDDFHCLNPTYSRRWGSFTVPIG